ncbi:MAG: NTP transferase domain-containing protein, partial [Desulfobulbaceae bacterium]|nr:NTP transferase domain-containing protein [Desulfobulbaceae bacterium]
MTNIESTSATNEQANPETFAIIMAGGVGTRLWPLSRKNRPKQFLDFFGDGTMIEKSVARLKGLVPIENILIVTNNQGKELALEHVPEIPADNIIVEPVGRNTAPCIALATAYIRKRNPDATAIVLPADHLIPDTARFQETLRA